MYFVVKKNNPLYRLFHEYGPLYLSHWRDQHLIWTVDGVSDCSVWNDIILKMITGSCDVFQDANILVDDDDVGDDDVRG